MNFPPTAFLIGAQKAGTTTLAHLLDQHPHICLSNPKEPRYFNAHFDRGVEWYRSCFQPRGDEILLDASPTYTMSPVGADGRADDTIAKRIKQLSPDARLIYLVRDPLARAYSAYLHGLRSEFETQSFRAAVAENKGYFDNSRYYAQAQPFIEQFGRDKLLFLSFEELTREPLTVARKVLEFLEAPSPDFEFTDEGARNQAFEYSGFGQRLRNMMGSEDNIGRLGQIVREFTPGFMHGILKRVVQKGAQELSQADRDEFADVFKADNERLKELSGIEFS